MKFSVGLQNGNVDFLNEIINAKSRIYEVYFSWGDFPNGRNIQTQSDSFTEWEMQNAQVNALKRLSDNGIELNI